MRQTVQIKALLIEGRHDALIAFNARYSKLFANKLLLRLCEGLIPTYKPSLALFDEQAQQGSRDGCVVNIKIHNATSPLMFAFYESLPYGSRMAVMVNLMNSYVQLAEADPKLMEKLFWEGNVQKAEGAPSQLEPSVRKPEDNTPVKTAEVVGPSIAAVSRGDATGQRPRELSNGTPQLGVDPLLGVDTGL